MRRPLAWSIVLLASLLACAAENDEGPEAERADAAGQPPGASSGAAAASSSSSGSSTSSSGNTPSAEGGTQGDGGAIELPSTTGLWDYQIGTPYPPPAGVTVVSRDRSAAAAVGVYSICYVNGFQAQQSENDFWLDQHPELVLREDGEPVIDEDWNEMLLDVSTPDKRAAIAAIADGWFSDCANKGFRAIEIDNLDTFSRSNGLLSEDDCVAMERLFADAAHARGLAIGQKNSAELVARRTEMDTDFAVVEECNRYDECDVFTDGYGAHVYVVEYRDQDFAKGCSGAHPPTVRRDLELVGPDHQDYRYAQCP